VPPVTVAGVVFVTRRGYAVERAEDLFVQFFRSNGGINFIDVLTSLAENISSKSVGGIAALL
jgi:hypothetical protein